MKHAILPLIVIMLAFSIAPSPAQRARDGISWFAESDSSDWEVKTVAGMTLLGEGHSNYATETVPVIFHWISHPHDAVKPEATAYISGYFGGENGEGNNGAGAFLAAGIRCDFHWMENLYTAVRFGWYEGGMNLLSYEYREQRPAFYLNWSQEYAVTGSMDLLLAEGVSLIPAQRALLPSLFLGLRLGRVFTLGIDVPSFWMTREHALARYPTIF